MDAQLRVLSPRLPVRKVKFLRQCREVEPSTWAVVDVSVDGILGEDGGGAPPAHKAKFLPSGCLIEERNNGYCKVTWIVNMECEVATRSEVYHPLLRSGQALGACRWLASLQRQCDYLVILHSYTNNGDMTPNGRMNIFDVAQRMTRSFYLAVSGPWRQPWRSLGEWDGVCGIGTESFKVVALTVSSGASMEQAGAVVLNVIAPVRLPGVPPQQVFDYLCDVNRRGEWDNLANGAPVLQEGHYTTAQLPGNAVSVLRTIASEVTNSKLILQEACADTSCMVLAYATLDEQYMMQHAMNNGGPASLPLLPSGVVILPDGAPPVSAACSSSTAVSHGSGSLVAVMYQKRLNGQPSYEDIDYAGNLLCRVIRKIKDTVHANIVEAA